MSFLVVNQTNSGNFKTLFDNTVNSLLGKYLEQTIYTLSPEGIKLNKVDVNESSVIRKFDTNESTPTIDVGPIFKKGIGFMHWNGTVYERDVSNGYEFIPFQSHKGYIKVWNYTEQLYDVTQFGYQLKPTVANPLTVTFLTSNDLGTVSVTSGFAGQVNPNGTPVSFSLLNSNSFLAYTTSGGSSILISYIAHGWSSTSAQ